MVYPVILLLFALVVIIILTTFVIPKIGAQLVAAKQELPWITKQLMNASYIMTSWWVVLVIAGIVAAIWGTRRFFKTPRGAFMRDKFILSLPVLGPLIKQRVVSRFASTLSTLLGSGLSMSESFSVVGEVTGNTLMKRAIDQSRERILAGADIATPLRDSGVIDPSIAHMVTVGEKSGELETMLKIISDSLEESTDIVIERISAAIEPVVIVFIAVIVGIIALAIMMPILKISQMAM
jgi:general secretion pathway protein F